MVTREYSANTGSSILRKEVVDAMVKQVAARSYKFKQACAIVPTNAWTNNFFREQTAIPAGQSGNATKGLPRGANFPQYSLTWQEVTGKILKFGLEDNIPWETLLASEINVQTRTVIRLTEGVVKAVDDYIWDQLTESRAGTGVIQSFAVVQGRVWNGASAAIIDDIMKASRLIEEANYDTNDLMMFVSPKDHQSIMRYVGAKGS